MEKLHSEKLANKKISTTTQNFLDVSEVKEGVIVLKSGTLRAVLAVSAINFDLKSTQEQDAIIAQYQRFLNSLDFPVQILINSRKISMKSYLEFLENNKKKQSNELLRIQLSSYKSFIEELISVSNIMEKKFYIVIPFSPIENKESGFFSNLSSLINPKRNILEKRENFETYKSQLYQRTEHIITALSGIGLRIAPLKTEELIELLFDSYNPEIFNASELLSTQDIDLSK